MRTAIATENAPAAIGAYSQAIRQGDQLWISGQLGLDPKTGEFAGEDLAAQTNQALDNLEAIATAAGTSLKNATKCTIFLVDMADFPVVNELYAARLGEPYPARATVAVAGLPKGGRVEIDAVIDCSN